MSRERGVTIVEMMVAMAVAIFIMFATYQLYAQSREWLEKPRASYSIQEDLMQLSRCLSRDLEETNLMTVQSFPNKNNAQEPPGLALESPRTADDQLVISEFGNVRWQKYVYYRLVPVDDTVGNIVRIEGPLSDQSKPMDGGRRIPVASGKLPSQMAMTNSRVVAHNVLLPKVSAPGLGSLDEYGGFKVTGLLPGETIGALPGGSVHEEPLRIDLKVLETSKQTNKVSALTMTLQVMPRN